VKNEILEKREELTYKRMKKKKTEKRQKFKGNKNEHVQKEERKREE
jgi:hypothetical protein